MTPERFAKLKQVLARRQPDLTVVTDNVHKGHNISAILRTCDAVGVYGMHAVSPGGEFRRHHMISGGSKKWVQVTFHDSVNIALRRLKDSGFQLVAAHLSEDALDYRSVDYTVPTALVLGAELDGVSGNTLTQVDRSVAIPMEGMVESLNVSVAAALILYEAQRQRRDAGLYDDCRLDAEVLKRDLFEWAHPDIAARCRAKEVAYPDLTPGGDLASNPLSQIPKKNH